VPVRLSVDIRPLFYSAAGFVGVSALAMTFVHEKFADIYITVVES
jgi:hypothetical protein